jgi:hypothetical protein
MSTSFVSINGNGFWMNDSILELFLRLLSLHIEDPRDERSPARRLRDEWLFASLGYCTGFCPVDLEEHTNSPEGKAIVLAALESLLVALKNGPPALDKGVLNVLGTGGGLTQDFESTRLIDVGESFAALINGRVFGGPGGNFPMPGSRRAA